MLVGRTVAPVSGGIGVAHRPIVEHSILLSEMAGNTSESHFQASKPDLTLRFYDTVGLEHRPSPWSAIKARLRRSSGVDVIVYCMRRGRLSNEQATHLRTIQKTYCQEDVPLLLVISGVDFRRGSTERWWETNIEDLKSAVNVEFADHICLNTWEPDHPSWKHQGASYKEAQRLVRDLVLRHCRSLHSDL